MADDVSVAAGIFRCLVRYGICGRVGRFGSIRNFELCRGDRVVVHTDRGMEVGAVLIGHEQLAGNDQRPPTGEVVRRATAEDLRVLLAMQAASHAVVERCRQRLSELQLGITLVDAEALLDGRTTVLYFLGESSEALGRLSVELAVDPRQRVRFEPLVLPDTPAEDDSLEAVDDIESTTAISEHSRKAVAMKGPYERLKYDFRRVWECAVCHRRERTEGTVTFRFCSCTGRDANSPPNSMKMVEDGARSLRKTRPRWPLLPEELGPALWQEVAEIPPSPPAAPPSHPEPREVASQPSAPPPADAFAPHPPSAN